MAVYIIKPAQNKASIMNSSVGLVLTEEYFTVTGCYGSYKYAYKFKAYFSRPMPQERKRRGGHEERRRRL